MAKTEELAEIIGYPPNGVSPLGAPNDVPVLVDDSLLEFPSVLIGAGQAAVEIELPPTDLTNLAKAQIGAFTRR